jgi:hypothetical protein
MALFILIVSTRVLSKLRVPWVIQSVSGVIAIAALLGFVATYWVILRYPYIGLVDAADGDLYAKYFDRISLFVKKLAGLLLATGLGLSLWGVWRDGQLSLWELLWSIYGSCTLIFLIFVLLKFNRFDHPAVATMLRCSMGIGVLLFPLFLPGIIVGSSRAKRLLGQAQDQLTS